MKRNQLAAIGQETLEIQRHGEYQAPSGNRVSILQEQLTAQSQTICYLEGDELPDFDLRDHSTHFQVTNETTLQAAHQLCLQGEQVCALNFASAKHPGGGFLRGAQAQEESLCRASGLYSCLLPQAMYRVHSATTGGFYTNAAIDSPRVPVFRGENDELLEEPYLCSFVTAPAVNAGVYLRSDRSSRAKVETEMRRRVDKVLTIMAGQGHHSIVLGAWGAVYSATTPP